MHDKFSLSDGFTVQDFFQKLLEKLRANHPAVKILIMSWITFLDLIPECNIISFLHELLPGLFSMLCVQTKDVNQSADQCLKHFLTEIEAQYEEFYDMYSDVINKIVDVVIEHCKSKNEQVTISAFEWLSRFLTKYHSILSNYFTAKCKIQAGYYKKLNVEGNLSPEFSFKLGHISTFQAELDSCGSETKNGIRKKTKDDQIMKIPYFLFPKILEVILLNVTSQNEQINFLIRNCNTIFLKIIDYLSSDIPGLNVKNLEEVLKNSFDTKKDATIEWILTWVIKLFSKFHDEMFTKVDDFIERFTNILPENNEIIFNKILDILCELAKYKEEYVEIIVQKLTEKLSLNRNILYSSGLTILKRLSMELPVLRVYSKFADTLMKEKDIEFLSDMINILDIFLLTEPEALQLRKSLWLFRKESDKEMKFFFEKLFTVWSYNPISTLILSIISEYFELSYRLILELADVKLDQEYYVQLSQLVQLIESSLLSNIRILLLEPVKNVYLVKTLYGILMLLPQGKAYNALAKRLKSIEILLLLDDNISSQNVVDEQRNKEVEYFIRIFNTAQALKKQNSK